MSDDELLALLAEELPAQPPEPHVRARLVSTLQGATRWAPYAEEIAHVFAIELGAVREALGLVERGDWQPGPWPGSRWLRTEGLTRGHALIADMPAGLTIARHRHPGRELTYILDGELLEDGQVHRSGELVDKAPGSVHALTVVARCLVVFALPA